MQQRVGAQRIAYAAVLLALEIAYTLLGLAADSDNAAIRVAYHWSAPAGVVLMALLVVVAAIRHRSAAGVVAVLLAARFVAVVVALLAVGSDSPNGRADGNYLLIVFYGTVVPLLEVLLAMSIWRVLRYPTDFASRT